MLLVLMAWRRAGSKSPPSFTGVCPGSVRGSFCHISLTKELTHSCLSSEYVLLVLMTTTQGPCCGGIAQGPAAVPGTPGLQVPVLTYLHHFPPHKANPAAELIADVEGMAIVALTSPQKLG